MVKPHLPLIGLKIFINTRALTNHKSFTSRPRFTNTSPQFMRPQLECITSHRRAGPKLFTSHHRAPHQSYIRG